MAAYPNLQKRIAFGCILGCLILVVIASLCEVLIRLTHPVGADPRHHLSQEMTHHPLQGWIGRSGFSGEVGTGDIRTRINAHGYRDDDFDEKMQRSDAENRARILFIGDSLTYGYRLEEAERLTEQVAFVAAGIGKRIETFNAGMPGYGTGQEFRALESLLPRLRPDVVVLWYCSNDVGDSAVPYDFRLAHRVYKPFFDLDGQLVRNQTVPKRFSYRVEGTWLGNWHICYLIDWLQYKWEDRVYAPDIHLWGSPGVTDPPVLTPAENKLFMRNLAAMAQVPELRPFFDVNRRRNLALWRRMDGLCRDVGTRFVLLFDDHDGTDTTGQMMREAAGQGIEVLAYGDKLNPYRAWAGIWGDGHPNAVQNYLAAQALIDHLMGIQAEPDFLGAPWIAGIPDRLDLGRDASRKVLNGEWGRFERAGREAGTQSLCVLRPPVDGARLDLVVRGDVRKRGTRIRVSCNHLPVGEQAEMPAGPFVLRAPVTSGHPGLLFVHIRAEPNIQIAEIGVEASAGTAVP